MPRAMRAKILDGIHGAHMGESKSLSFVRDYMFWPAMTFVSVESAMLSGTNSKKKLSNHIRYLDFDGKLSVLIPLSLEDTLM